VVAAWVAWVAGIFLAGWVSGLACAYLFRAYVRSEP
jgi:hypothetical protein